MTRVAPVVVRRNDDPEGPRTQRILAAALWASVPPATAEPLIVAHRLPSPILDELPNLLLARGGVVVAIEGEVIPAALGICSKSADLHSDANAVRPIPKRDSRGLQPCVEDDA